MLRVKLAMPMYLWNIEKTHVESTTVINCLKVCVAWQVSVDQTVNFLSVTLQTVSAAARMEIKRETVDTAGSMSKTLDDTTQETKCQHY